MYFIEHVNNLNVCEMIGLISFKPAFINKNQTIRKEFDLSIFTNDWDRREKCFQFKIVSIRDETFYLNKNWIEGLRVPHYTLSSLSLTSPCEFGKIFVFENFV